MRPVVPDIDLWANLVDFFNFLGAVQAGALLACVAGLVIAAWAWGVGRAWGLSGLASAGKIGVLVIPVAAFCTAALPGMIGWVIRIFS